MTLLQRALASVRRAMCGAVPGARVFDLRLDDHELCVRALVNQTPTAELVEELDAALAEVTADFPFPEKSDPSVRLSVVRADADWECLFDTETLLVDAVHWRLARKVDAKLRQAIVAGVFAAADLLEKSERAGERATPRWVERLAVMAADDAMGQEEVRRVFLQDGELHIAFPKYTWVSSYETGFIACSYASIPGRYLPANPATALQLVKGIVALGYDVAVDEGPTEFVCRFCGRTLGAIDFHRDIESCHSCAESKLGVVH